MLSVLALFAASSSALVLSPPAGVLRPPARATLAAARAAPITAAYKNGEEMTKEGLMDDFGGCASPLAQPGRPLPL